MKRLIFLTIIFISSFGACSSLPNIVMKFSQRRYRPCTQKEINRSSPEWDGRMMFCWRYCAKYKKWRSHISENCKVWKVDVLQSKEDFEKVRAAGFVLINEDRIY